MNVNPSGIYGSPPEGFFYSPFGLQVDPMKRLLLIGFEKDPDKVYVGFEPQVFDDPVNGRGMLVVAWRADGFIDVYHQPGLNVAHKDFSIVGKGLADLVERPLEQAKFEVTAVGVDAHFSFEDKEGRPVEVLIREGSARPAKPFALLAPVGSAVAAPPALPLFFLYGFYFVRRAGTEVRINVDGVNHAPDSLPLPLDGSWMYFLRYSADPLIATWNPAHDGPLAPLRPGGAGEVRDGHTFYDIVENNGHYEIRRMRTRNQRHEIRVDFSPPVPDIVCLGEGAEVRGRFVVAADESSGTVGGGYEIHRGGRQTTIRIRPSEGWLPNERKRAVRFIYRVAPVFRNWPKTYVWTANVQSDGAGRPTMHSRWERTKRAE